MLQNRGKELSVDEEREVWCQETSSREKRLVSRLFRPDSLSYRASPPPPSLHPVTAVRASTLVHQEIIRIFDRQTSDSSSYPGHQSAHPVLRPLTPASGRPSLGLTSAPPDVRVCDVCPTEEDVTASDPSDQEPQNLVPGSITGCKCVSRRREEVLPLRRSLIEMYAQCGCSLMFMFVLFFSTWNSIRCFCYVTPANA